MFLISYLVTSSTGRLHLAIGQMILTSWPLPMLRVNGYGPKLVKPTGLLRLGKTC